MQIPRLVVVLDKLSVCSGINHQRNVTDGRALAMWHPMRNAVKSKKLQGEFYRPQFGGLISAGGHITATSPDRSIDFAQVCEWAAIEASCCLTGQLRMPAFVAVYGRFQDRREFGPILIFSEKLRNAVI